MKKWIDSYKLEYRGLGPRKIPKNFIRPSKEKLFELYNNQKLTLREIGEKYQVTKTTIKRWFNEYELKVRSNPTDAKLAKKNIILPTKEQLIKDYEFFSLELIAKKYGVSIEPILTLLNKYNIEKRNRSESKKLAGKTGRAKIWNKGLSMENPKVAKMINTLHKKQMEKIEIIRKKVSETHKKLHEEGKIEVWNKGKKLSKEHRENIGKGIKGRPAPNKGIPISEKTRKKLSKLFSGKNNPFYGKKHTEKTRKKISETVKAEMRKPDVWKKFIENNSSLRTRAKRRASINKPEIKKKIGDASKKNWQDAEFIIDIFV